jgi:hypothetical protein
MAVKGKKKSQSRGSQGRRGPAQAPRAAYSATAPVPWYRTTAGLVLAGLALLIALIAIIALVRSGSDAPDLTNRKDALDQYTGDIRGLLQDITPPAAGENGVPNKLSVKDVKALKDQSATWVSQLQQAGQNVGKVTPPTPGAQSANVVFAESVQLYVQAARIYGLAPSTSPSVQEKMLASGASLRDQATSLWQQGVNLLDQARSAAKMPPSQLRLPTAGAVAPPSATATPSPSGSAATKGKNKKKSTPGGNSSK